MSRLICVLLVFLCITAWAPAQQPQSDDEPAQEQLPPRSDGVREGTSSSRDSRIDISPPKDDAKSHPYSSATISDAETDTSGDVQEFHPWDPHKAAKDIEVGDFYFKRKNYRAALDRYREALTWKPNDALANLHMAECYEKLKQPDEAIAHYQEYLRILPHGPLSEEVQKSLEKVKTEKNQASGKVPSGKP